MCTKAAETPKKDKTHLGTDPAGPVWMDWIGSWKSAKGCGETGNGGTR